MMVDGTAEHADAIVVPDLDGLRCGLERRDRRCGEHPVGVGDPDRQVLLVGSEHPFEEPDRRTGGRHEVQVRRLRPIEPRAEDEVDDPDDVVAVMMGEKDRVEPCGVLAGFGQPEGGRPAGVELEGEIASLHQNAGAGTARFDRW